MPVQGASTSTRSISPCKGVELRRAWRRPGRCGLRRASAARRSAQAAPCRCRRRRSGRGCPWRPTAPGSCRRRRRRNRAPAWLIAARSSAATICEPSSCTSNQPFWNAGSACTLGWRPSPSIGAMRMPWGADRWARRRSRPGPRAPVARSAFSVLTRRSSGGRAASAARPRRPSPRRRRLEAAARTTRGNRPVQPLAPGRARRSASRASSGAVSGGRRERDRRRAGVQATPAVSAPFEQQRAECQRARRVAVEQPARRALRRKRVIDDVADRGAVAGAGETVRQAPILQRLRHRPVAAFDVVEDLDGGRQPAAEPHGQVSPNRCSAKNTQMAPSTAAPKANTRPRGRSWLPPRWMAA